MSAWVADLAPARAGDRAAQARVLAAFEKSCRRLVRGWRLPSTMTRDDAVQDCRIGVLDAIRTYDKTKGTFVAWATLWMRARLSRNSTQERAGSAPFRWGRDGRGQWAPVVALDAPIFDDDDETTALDVLADHGVAEEMDAGLHRLALEKALADLDPKHRSAIEMRLQGLEQKEIGARLGVCPSRISQILAQALEPLRARLGGGDCDVPPPAVSRPPKASRPTESTGRISRSRAEHQPPSPSGLSAGRAEHQPPPQPEASRPPAKTEASSSLRERIARGDMQALAEAYRAFRPLARKVLCQLGRHAADYDDLTQEAFLLLPRCARRCAPDTSLGGCVVTAVHQACREWDSRKATHGHARRRVYLEEGELLRVADLETNPEEATSMRQRVHHLSALVEQLPPRQREALIAREMEGLSNGELTERFGTTLKTAENTVHNARVRLAGLAAESPLADVFAAMPRRGDGSFSGYSRSSRWRRRKLQHHLHSTAVHA